MFEDVTQSNLTLNKNAEGINNISGVSSTTKSKIKNANEVVIITTHNQHAGAYFHFINTFKKYGGTTTYARNNTFMADNATYYENISLGVNFSSGDILGNYTVGGWTQFSTPKISKICVR